MPRVNQLTIVAVLALLTGSCGAGEAPSVTKVFTNPGETNNVRKVTDAGTKRAGRSGIGAWKLTAVRTRPVAKKLPCPRCGTRVKGRGTITKVHRFRTYEIIFYRDPRTGYNYEILRKGRSVRYISDIVYGPSIVTRALPKTIGACQADRSVPGWRADLAQCRRSRLNHHWTVMGTDITGDREPNLVVLHNDHRAESLAIYALGTKFRTLFNGTVMSNGAREAASHFLHDFDGDGCRRSSSKIRRPTTASLTPAAKVPRHG